MSEALPSHAKQLVICDYKTFLMQRFYLICIFKTHFKIDIYSL